MIIKLKVSLSGPEVGSHKAGDVVDWPDFDVPNLLRAGYAEVVGVEVAAVQVPETAAKPRAIKRRQ